MKKVFIGVLCALMLFGFVACDNNTPSGMVYSIEATQTAVYVEGETPTADGFSFVGYTNLGEAVSIDASKIAFYPAGSDRYSMTYMGIPVAGTVEVDFVPVESVSVDASGAVTSYYARLAGYSYEEAAAVDTTGLVVTVTYDGGTKVIDVDDLDVKSDVTNWETVGEYTVTVSIDGKEDTYDIEIVPNLVTSVAARSTENYTVYHTGEKPATSDLPKYLTATEVENEVKGYWMEKTYQGNEVVVVDSAYVDYQMANGNYVDTFAAANLVPAEDRAVSVTMKYTGEDGTTSLTGSSRNSSVSISWAKKEAVSIEVTKTAKELSKGSSFDGQTTSLFAFDVTYNDGSVDSSQQATWWDGEGETPKTNYIILEQREAIKDYTVGDRYTFSVSGSVAGLSFSQSFEAVVK